MEFKISQLINNILNKFSQLLGEIFGNLANEVAFFKELLNSFFVGLFKTFEQNVFPKLCS